MGILHKMLLVLQKIDPESKQWLSKKLARIDNEILRKELEKKLKTENWDYIHKLGIIQNSIYGVDIQPIAVEISKLRFFLSLIVDEKIDDNKPNRGVVPLPNLEFKFVAANSLIGLPLTSSLSQMELFEARDYINRLKELRDAYFTSYGEEKDKIEQEFQQIQNKMFEYARKEMVTHKKTLETQTLKLSEWNPFADEASSWFDPEWMFGMKEGFNIVIANPPYVRVDDINPLDREKYKNTFTTTTGKYDLYYLFFEKSLVLCKYVDGCCVFISPNRYCAADSATNLRRLLFNSIVSGEILSTSNLKVFDSVANYPIISIFKTNNSKHGSLIVRQAMSIDTLREKNPLYSYTADINDLLIFPQMIIPINISLKTYHLLLHLYRKSILLSELMSISEGLRIPARLESASRNDYEIVKQYQFSKYSNIRDGSYISKKNIETVITSNSERYKKIMVDKILIAEDALEINATIDFCKRIPQGGVYFAIARKLNLKLKYLLGILNSKLLSYIYEALYSGMHMGGGYLRYRSKFLENLPVPKSFFEMSNKGQNDVISVVDKILNITKGPDYPHNTEKQAKVSALECQIDKMVYELYDLTPQEIEMVEGK